jgi:hypothetical protein
MHGVLTIKCSKSCTVPSIVMQAAIYVGYGRVQLSLCGQSFMADWGMMWHRQLTIMSDVWPVWAYKRGPFLCAWPGTASLHILLSIAIDWCRVMLARPWCYHTLSSPVIQRLLRLKFSQTGSWTCSWLALPRLPEVMPMQTANDCKRCLNDIQDATHRCGRNGFRLGKAPGVRLRLPSIVW